MPEMRGGLGGIGLLGGSAFADHGPRAGRGSGWRRVEVGFTLDGLPFRLAGVVQPVHDRYTIGVRPLELSDRKRAQLTMVIEELEEAQQQEDEAGKESGELAAE